MKLKVKAFALTCGILWAITIFVATFWTMARGGGNTLVVLNQFYFGYSVSIPGAFIGLVWGFIDGFICGAVFAWLYNKLAGVKE